MYSLVAICVKTKLKTTNEFFESIGQGPNYLTVPLSNNGIEVTHYACRADVTEEVKAQIEAAQLSITLNFSTTEQPYEHFVRVLDEMSLALFA